MFRERVNETVELCLLEPAHAARLFRVIDRNRSYLREWLPWLDKSRSSEDVASHIRENLEHYRRREALSAGIWVDGAISGAISIHKIDLPNRNASIGYWLDAACQGRGIMTGACRVIVNRAFGVYGLHRVEIRCATGNSRSCAIAARLGFRQEGVIREAEWLYDRFVDLEIWGVLKHEWAGGF